MKPRPLIAAYYFPNWHCDPRIEALHGRGWTEWRVAQYATPRFPGHWQPRVPLWGYQDESRPEVMARKITAARSYGVDAFIFDWYCFDDGPYRTRALDHGFLAAPNCAELRFALMWCNHNPIYAHPGSYWKPAEKNWNGETITPETFRRWSDYYIEHYFSRPNYLRVDGGLYFSFWQPLKLIAGFGGPGAAAALFREWRAKIEAAGLGELNLNAHCDAPGNTPEILSGYEATLRQAGFNSISHYGWDRKGDRELTLDYADWMRDALPAQREYCLRFALPSSPLVAQGWDVSPRTVQSDIYDTSRGYPFCTVVVNHTPERFAEALRYARTLYEEGVSRSEMIQIACWNEWTEGAYLEPDTRFGYGFLEAVREVFGCGGGEAATAE